jgi:hypothetical protein
MTTTLISRVGARPAADNTRRVPTTGAVAAVPVSLGGDTWGNTWHGAWGRTWLAMTPAVAAVSASPAVDVTQRVGSAPSANTTKRVSLA